MKKQFKEHLEDIQKMKKDSKIELQNSLELSKTYFSENFSN